MGGKSKKAAKIYWKGLALGAGIWCLMLLAVILIWPYRFAWAASFDQNTGAALGLGTLPLDEVVRNIIRWALGFLGLIAVILIVYGGFLWMTAAGNEERIEKAKSVIRGAIIGLIIVLLSFAIVQFFFYGVTSAINGTDNNNNGNSGGPGDGDSAQFYVRLVSPHEDEDNVPLCRFVQGVFNRRINESTGALTLTQVDTGQDIQGSITYQDGNKIKLDPSADLNPLKQYRALIPDTVKDTQGNELDQQKEWYFTTSDQSDSNPPTVANVWPDNGATDICLATPIVVEFNEPMDMFTLIADNVTVTGPGNPHVSSVDVPNDRTMAITLSAPLDPNQSYTVTLNGTPGHIADACGNPLDGNGDGTGGDNYDWSFSTGVGQDCSPKINTISGSGYYETDVTIEGTNFTDIPNTAVFTNDATAFNNCFNTNYYPNNACVKEWTNTHIKVTLPASGGASNGAIDGSAKVRVGSLESNGKNFNVQAPHISTVDPASGGPGQFVTIRGTNFGSSAGRVLFRKSGDSDIEGDQSSCEAWWQDDQIIIKVPEGFNLNDVTQIQIETSGNRRSNLEDFHITNQVGPGLCSIAPHCGGLNTEITLVGEALGSSGQVKYDNTTATTTEWTEGQIKANTPDVADRANPYNVTATVGGLVSNGLPFNKPCGSGDDPGSGAACSSNQSQCVPDNGLCTIVGETCRPSDCTCRAIPEGAACSSDQSQCVPDNTQCNAQQTCRASDCTCRAVPEGASCSSDQTQCVPDNTQCNAQQSCRASDCTCRTIPAGAPCSSDQGQCVPDNSMCSTDYTCGVSDCACHYTNPGGSGTSCSSDQSQCVPDNGLCTIVGETCRPSDCTCRPLPTFTCSSNQWQCVRDQNACAATQGCIGNCTCADRPTFFFYDPSDQQSDVCRNIQFNWTFTKNMQGSTAHDTNIQLTIQGGAAAGAACTVDKDCASDQCGGGHTCVGSFVGGSFSQPSDKHFLYGNYGLLEPDTFYHVLVVGRENGVLSTDRLGIPADTGYTFKTSTSICDINRVEIDPASWQFVQRDASKQFTASALHDSHHIVSIPGVYEFNWEWSTNDATIVTVSPLDNATTTATIQNKDGHTKINAKATVVTPGREKEVTGQADIQVNLCEHPWPDPGAGLFVPFTDSDTNFSFWYCAENGLPLITSQVTGSSGGELIKEYFFKGLHTCQGTSKACTIDADCDGVACTELPDAIGVRVMTNQQHYSPKLWYQTTLPAEPIPNGADRMIDGYPSIRVGRTNYVSAANAVAQTYTNMYLISYSENAQSVTQQVYNELISHWHLTINQNDDDKQKLVRDVRRLGDISDVGHYLDQYHAKNQSYPNLQAGSYLVRRSSSAWPSWQATLGNALGKGLPSDPLNTFVYDPASCHVPPYDHDTCWWGDRTLYPTDGGRFTCQDGSSVYMYRFVPDGSTPPVPANDKAELYARLEFPNWAGLVPGQNPCAGTVDGSQCACFNYRKDITP